MTEKACTLTNASLYMAVGFVVCTMVANIMSLRMVAPFGIVMDAGTLLYPATFVLRDALHRRAGLHVSNRVITLSVLCNIGMFALFALTSWLPADEATGEQTAFAAVLMPGFLIVAGSVIAQFVSERIDGAIYDRLSCGATQHHFRSAFISNCVSIPLDSVIMAEIAFGFTTPQSSVLATIAANVVLKFVLMVIFLAATQVKMHAGEQGTHDAHGAYCAADSQAGERVRDNADKSDIPCAQNKGAQQREEGRHNGEQR